MTHLICGCKLIGAVEVLHCPAAAALAQQRRCDMAALIVAKRDDWRDAYRRWQAAESAYANHFAQLALEAA